nr:ORF2 [Red fox Torque teno virus 2]
MNHLVEKEKLQALWLRNCSLSHSIWCTCNDWTSHIKGIQKAPWRLTEDTTGDDTENPAVALADAFAADGTWDVDLRSEGDGDVSGDLEKDNI